MKRVLIVTYYWPPSGGAGVQRWLKFTKYLPDFDWEPYIITVDPEHATYPLLDDSLDKEVSNELKVIRTKSREWFSAYKKVSGSEKIPYGGFANDKEKISSKQKLARFVRGNLFIPDPRKGWNRFALSEALRLLKKEQFHCVITTGPPHSSHLIGLKLSRKTGVPWVADFRDPWTDIYYYRKFYPTKAAHQINLRMENKVLSRAKKVITVSDGFKKIFANKRSVPEEKIFIIPNGFDENDFQPGRKNKNEVFRITYVGTLADSYPLDSFIEALMELKEQKASVRLRFIGSISDFQKQKLEVLEAESIEYIQYVDHKKALAYMQDTTVLLLVIPDHDSSNGILPGKIFEYLASEKPIIGIGPVESDSSNILQETGAGKMIAFNDKEGMLRLLEAHYKDFKNNIPYNLSDKYLQYSRKNLSRRLSEILNELN